MTSPALPPAIAALTQQIARMQAQIAQLQRNQRTSQLGNTSIDNGTLTINGPDGTAQMLLGLQYDGAYTVRAVSSVGPPVAPDTPVAGPGIQSVLVAWDGVMADRSMPLSDFAGVQVHCSPVEGFTPGEGTLQGILPAAGAFIVGGLAAGTVYYVALVAVNESGQVSAPSAQASATAQSVLQNIAANSITATLIAAGTILAGAVDGTTITGAQIIADGLSGQILIYSGTPAYGNLIGAWSTSAGDDIYGNPYPAGLLAQDGLIAGYAISSIGAFLSTLHVTSPPSAISYSGSNPGTNTQNAGQTPVDAGHPASNSNADLYTWATEIANGPGLGDLNQLSVFCNAMSIILDDTIGYENALGTEVYQLILAVNQLVINQNAIISQLQTAGIFT
jgi:hypothetical protein